MRIEELNLVNFRNYGQLALRPHEGVNLFFGPNGSGKTNLLEAVHYCCLGKSHRLSNDQGAVRIGESFASCEVAVRNDSARNTVSVRLVPNEQQKKTILLNGKKIRRFSDMMGTLQCVIFSPEDLGLIREGPSLRRRYLDMMISQFDRTYFIALQQYRLGLEQRNALLKQARAAGTADRAPLEDFERAMLEPARIIVMTRRKVIARLEELAVETYRGISGRESEVFQVAYHSSLKDAEDIGEALAEQLRESRQEDLRQGLTGVGPHRDDLALNLNRKNMKQFASQGQIRTGALSLKLSQMKILEELGGEKPVLLLDDVMSELDRNRRTRLIGEIGGYQTFITCTDESDMEEEPTRRVYRVTAADGEARVDERNTGTAMPVPEMKEPDFT